MYASTATVPVAHEPPPESGLFAIPQLVDTSHHFPATPGRATPADEIRAQMADSLGSLRRRARYLARNRAEADDLVQDTVERALRFAESYHSGTNLRAWLLQIMYTVFASRCRRSKREKAVHSVLGHDPNANVSHRFAPTDGHVVLNGFVRELQALPEAYAEVLWLVDYQDYAYAEAAQQLGVPLGTVMSRLHRARRMMRGALDPLAAVG